MLAMRVIPCLGVKDGRVVKGVRFQGLRDAGDPAERAHAYELQGADELVLLDVSATPEGRGNALETVRKVRQVLSIPLAGGGGIQTHLDTQRPLAARKKVELRANVARVGLISGDASLAPTFLPGPGQYAFLVPDSGATAPPQTAVGASIPAGPAADPIAPVAPARKAHTPAAPPATPARADATSARPCPIARA